MLPPSTSSTLMFNLCYIAIDENYIAIIISLILFYCPALVAHILVYDTFIKAQAAFIQDIKRFLSYK